MTVANTDRRQSHPGGPQCSLFVRQPPSPCLSSPACSSRRAVEMPPCRKSDRRHPGPEARPLQERSEAPPSPRFVLLRKILLQHSTPAAASPCPLSEPAFRPPLTIRVSSR